MTIYLKYEYHLENATVASILFWWGAVSNFLPTLGAFLSDSYMGRFPVIALGSVVSLAVRTLLPSTSYSSPNYLRDFSRFLLSYFDLLVSIFDNVISTILPLLKHFSRMELV